MPAQSPYPFNAIVGQEAMKKALLLAAVSPVVGGVLIRGEKGTGKSTAVRALAALLPDIEAVEGCPCHCPPEEPERLCNECLARYKAQGALPRLRRPMPVVDLPLGATEDRLVGSLNLERALREGRRHFEPGLLAAANRGILYVDEVNLLDDHLVDVLLDVAASGVNLVEREGISVSHPAAFILVGTMNPEEGELRPQLLDRFGLCVAVRGLGDADRRAEIMRRRLEYEADPGAFAQRWAAEEATLKQAVLSARERLAQVTCPAPLLELAAGLCLRLGTAGHRADLAIVRCARALAALRGACDVERADIIEAARLALPHRLPRVSAEDDTTPQVSLEQALDETATEAPARSESQEGGGEAAASPAAREVKGQVAAAGSVHPLRQPFAPRGEVSPPRGGRRVTIQAQGPTGRYVAAAAPSGTSSFQIALDATLRAAALRQAAPGHGSLDSGDLDGDLDGNLDGNLALRLDWSDVRAKVRRRKVRSTVLFLVDASGSMGAGERMGEAKGAVLSLLSDARRRRDRVGLVSFRGAEATLLVAPTNDIREAEERLRLLPVGGATPLARGLEVARDTLRRHAPRGKEQALLVVISDGKPNRGSSRRASAQQHREDEAREAFHNGRSTGACLLEIRSAAALREALEVAEEIRRSGVKSLVVDTAERGRHNQMPRLAAALGADYVRLGELCAAELVQLVGRSLAPINLNNRR